ncbi:MAG: hypothetical protein HYU64_04435 [Armatimonadetes bacterium]|nr:hypothetical protein [Armatimonadota bacterium]
MSMIGVLPTGTFNSSDIARKGFKKEGEGNLADKVNKWSGDLVEKKSESGDFRKTATKVGIGAGLTTIGLLAMTSVASANAGHDHGEGSASVPATVPTTPTTTNAPASTATGTHGHSAAEHAQYLANHDKLQWDTREIIQHNFKGVDQYTHPITEDHLHVVMRDGYEAWNNEADALSSKYPDDVAHREVHSEVTGWHHDFQERVEHQKIGTYEVPRMWGDKFMLGSHLKAFPGDFKVCWEVPMTKEVKIGEVPNDLNEAKGPFQMFPSDVHIEMNPDGTISHVSIPTGVSSVTANNPVKNADGSLKMEEKCATIGEANSVTQGKVDEFNRNLLIGIGVVVGIGVVGAVAYNLIHRD